MVTVTVGGPLCQAGLIGGRFALQHEAGHGGMGTVYAATDIATGEVVAVKLLRSPSSEHAARFQREAQALASLSHRCIVGYRAHGESANGTPYLAMEWLQGEDLSRRLARGALPLDLALHLVRDIAEALGQAHRAGLLHRDIKPSNVFLVNGDVRCPKLLDFGIARSLGHGETLTHTGALIGTPQYMSPEQARATRALDPRSDVFSLGCLLFECVAGRPVYLADHVVVLLSRLTLEDAPRLSAYVADLPAPVDTLVGRMLARNPALRPADGDAVVTEIATLAQTLRDSATPLAHVERLTGVERRVVSLVVATLSTDQSQTLGCDEDLYVQEHIRAIAAMNDVSIEVMGGNTVLALASGGGSADELAARAARFSLALSALLPEGRLGVVTGRATLEQARAGDLITRALGLLSGAQTAGCTGTEIVDIPGDVPISGRGRVLTDAATAHLLESRFELQHTGHTVEVVRELRVPAPRSAILGRRAAMVGRERELGLLDSALAAAMDEPAVRLVLILAPPGAGKSRLCKEFAERLQVRPLAPRLLATRAEALSAGSPLALVRPLVEQLLGWERQPDALPAAPPVPRNPEGVRSGCEALVDAETAQRLAPFIGEIVGIPFDDAGDPALHAARRDPSLLAEAVRSAFRALVHASAVRDGLALLIDDLHLADLTSLALIEHAATTLQEGGMLVVASARPEVSDRFPSLWKDLTKDEIHLGPISRRAAEKLALDVLGADADREVVRRVVDRSDGWPLFLEELLRAAADPAAPEMPASIAGAIEWRLEQLTDEARLVLRVASTFGVRFAVAAVQTVVADALPAAEVAAALAELVRGEIIAQVGPVSPHGAAFEFRSGLLREAAYESWTGADRCVAHRRAARWLAEGQQADPAVLALHWQRGGEARLAAAGWLAAAERGLAGNDPNLAMACARDGLQQLDDAGAATDDATTTRVALIAVEAEALYARGDLAGAADRAVCALQQTTTGTVPWLRAASLALTAYGQRGLNEKVADLLKELSSCEPADEEEAVDALGVGLARAITQLMTVGGRAALATAWDRIQALAARPGKRSWQFAAWQARARGGIALRDGDLAGTAAAQQTLIDLCQTVGDTRGCIHARIGATSVLAWLGDFEHAEASADLAIAEAERNSAPYQADWARYARAKVWYEAGRCEAATAAMVAAAAALKASPRIASAAYVYASLAECEVGRWAAGVEHARQALATATSATGRAAAHAALGRALLAAGDLAAADDSSATGLGIVAAQGSIEEFETMVFCVRAEVLDALGRRLEAMQVIAPCATKLRLRATGIADLTLRQAFLSRVRENARALRLARQWGVPSPALAPSTEDRTSVQPCARDADP